MKSETKEIGHGQTTRFVYVFSKFHVVKGERILANLSERNTTRTVHLAFKLMFV